jgi:hypothetical protein
LTLGVRWRGVAGSQAVWCGSIFRHAATCLKKREKNSLNSNDSLEGKMAVDPLKNKRCWIKAQIFAQRASSGAAGVKV